VRPACINCCLKHLAQAQILIFEAKYGYPLHRHLAAGHLAEAAEEIYGKSPDLAGRIRVERKAYELDASRYNVNIMDLLQEVEDLNSGTTEPDRRTD